MSPELKIKVKSLATEAGYIRTEERKAKAAAGWCRARQFTVAAENHAFIRVRLYNHRKDVVRPEARHTLLAHSFLKGRTYKEVENSIRKGNWPDFDRIAKMLRRICKADEATMAEFKAWCPNLDGI